VGKNLVGLFFKGEFLELAKAVLLRAAFGGSNFDEFGENLDQAPAARKEGLIEGGDDDGGRRLRRRLPPAAGAPPAFFDRLRGSSFQHFRHHFLWARLKDKNKERETEGFGVVQWLPLGFGCKVSERNRVVMSEFENGYCLFF